MQRFMWILLLAVVWGCGANERKDKPAPSSPKYSADFARAADSVMQRYYQLTDAFVNWDTARIKEQAGVLLPKLDGIPQGEIPVSQQRKSATALVQARNDLNVMELSNNISDKRHALNSLTEHLFGFLQTVGYEGRTLYLQQCPMAFNDSEPGVWLSDRDTIRNPYLGLHHPTYGKAMIECGENKSTIGKAQ